MRLVDRDIIKLLDEGKIKITPRPSNENISGATVDLSLGDTFRVFTTEKVPFVDLAASKEELNAQLDRLMGEEIKIGANDCFYLHPGELALGVTLESVEIPDDMLAWLDGRSSLARLGLMVHVTAHRIDPGWQGKIVLEFSNQGKVPLSLKPGMKIGAISFEMLSGPALRPYVKRSDAKYKFQSSAVGSRIQEDHKQQNLDLTSDSDSTSEK